MRKNFGGFNAKRDNYQSIQINKKIFQQNFQYNCKASLKKTWPFHLASSSNLQ